MGCLVSSLPHDPESALVDRSGLSGSVTVTASPYPKLQVDGLNQKTTKMLAVAALGLFALKLLS